MTFRRRVFMVLIALVVLIESATFVAVLNTTRSNIFDIAIQQLQSGARVFDSAIENRSRELATGVAILASDFGFKRAVSGGDAPTIRSALANHGARINADLAMFINRDGGVHASTAGIERNSFAFPELLEQNAVGRIVELNAEAMQLVVAPVRAPELIGWVAIGFAIDDALARQIASLTALTVTFLSHAPGEDRVLASTLAETDRQGLTRATEGTTKDSFDDSRILDTGALLGLRHPVPSESSANLEVVLALPLAKVLTAYYELRTRLFVILVLALALSAGGARLLAGTVARPLHRLASAAHRISQGDYGEKVAISGSTELAILSAAFNDMQDGIRQREQRIVHQSQHDALTGLPNRSLVSDRLQYSIAASKRYARQFSILMIDLDGFKGINDTLGHAVGDQVLTRVAESLLERTRANDTVARLGGDEFMILLDESSPQHARTFAERLVDAAEKSVDVGSMKIRIDLSIGIVNFPWHGDTEEELIRRADIAMYIAKATDNSSVAEYQIGQDEEHLRRLSLVNDLRDAIDQDGMTVHFQPKVDLRTNRICAAEALVRWQHPRFGMQSPDEFIDLAEKSGLIRSLTRCVLRKVLLQLRAWHIDGIDLATSVNLSALDLLDENLPDFIAATLTECRLPAAYLTLEITESAVMRDAANARSTMKRLRELGIRLAIDDFGTGHSSLAQLKSLPVDELKIDKSFVLGLPKSEDDSEIVKSTIELAHNMGLSVTAEGVETTACRDLLRQFGCDVIQGYLVSRPLCVEDFSLWIRARLNERDTCMIRPELPAAGPNGVFEDELSTSAA